MMALTLAASLLFYPAMYLGAALGNSHPLAYAVPGHPLLSLSAMVAEQEVLALALALALPLALALALPLTPTLPLALPLALPLTPTLTPTLILTSTLNRCCRRRSVRGLA